MVQTWTLGGLADQAARRWPDRELMAFQGRRWTFGQAQQEIDRLARGLIGLGVGKGENVAFWMTNRPEWVFSMFALAKVGAVMVPINTRFRTVDLEYVVRQSDSTTLIAVERSGPIGFWDMVLEAAPEIRGQDPRRVISSTFPALQRVVALGDGPVEGAISWEDLLEAGRGVSAADLKRRQEDVQPDDTLFIMYTSGTTGFPKGVMHGHNVIRNIEVTADKLKVASDDCTIMYLPLFHAFGYFEGPLMCYLTGSRMVLTETFDPAEVLGLIESERGTILHGFDTHWQDLIDHPDFARRDVGCVRTGLLAAGLPSTVPVAERVNQRWCRTVTGWGMTEVMPAATVSHAEDTFEHATATSGRPNDGYECRIVDPTTGRRQPVGVPGEMLIRGFAVMQGYYKKPEETAKALDAEGWFHTGDMGVELPDGYIRFLGRYKEMLKIGGENVDPVEVEAYFLNHPAVSRVQIVGVPDQRLSEVPVAFVVLKPDVRADEEGLRAFARGKLASFKVPSRFFFVGEYPMTSSGKVQKFKLREMARARLGIDAPDIEQPATGELEAPLRSG